MTRRAAALTSRRAFLLAASASALVGCTSSAHRSSAPPPPSSPSLQVPAPHRPASAERTVVADGLRTLETTTQRRLGVYAIDTGSGRSIAYRAEERFAMCSTSKVLIAAAVLHRTGPAGLHRAVRYRSEDFVAHSPVTTTHLTHGMTIEQLAEAALRYSDNTATNVLLRELGGPGEATRFVRTLGDTTTRLDRYEPAVNQATPGDPRDTTTPRAIIHDYRDLALGAVLNDDTRRLLVRWLRTNTTGTGRIRAAVPPRWVVGDRTGTGDYGTSNDVALLWPPHRPPIAITVMSGSNQPDAEPGTTVLAQAARLALRSL